MLKFGPAGTCGEPLITIPQHLQELGLTAFEYECGHGVRLSAKTASELRENAQKHNITISLHSPYFISLTNPEKTENNINYIRQSAKAVSSLGGKNIVIHSGSIMKMTRELALSNAKETLTKTLQVSIAENWGDVRFCIETMGKINQLGTLTEVLDLCQIDEMFLPCIDFGHLYARTLGELNGYEAFAKILNEIENRVGEDRAKSCHIHFSHIEFTNGGEKKHRTFSETGGFGPDWEPLCELLYKRNYNSIVICESKGTQIADAVTMKDYYISQLNQ